MRLASDPSDRVRVREEAIDDLVRKAETRGDIPDRMYWTLIYDFEIAPQTTNLEQLRQAGVEILPASALTAGEVRPHLEAIISALADMDVYLLHTDHLSDRDLYDRLEGAVLRELVRDLPPGCGVHEYIDMAANETGAPEPIADRDRVLPRPRD